MVRALTPEEQSRIKESWLTEEQFTQKVSEIEDTFKKKALEWAIKATWEETGTMIPEEVETPVKAKKADKKTGVVERGTPDAMKEPEGLQLNRETLLDIEARRKAGQKITDFSISKVSFYKFSDKDLEEYLKKGLYKDRAGAYGIQDLDKRYLKKFEGSYSNILAIPLEKLEIALNHFGIKTKKNWQKKLKKDFSLWMISL